MDRPSMEMADIIRKAGQKFIEHSRRWITGQHLKDFGGVSHFS